MQTLLDKVISLEIQEIYWLRIRAREEFARIKVTIITPSTEYCGAKVTRLRPCFRGLICSQDVNSGSTPIGFVGRLTSNHTMGLKFWQMQGKGVVVSHNEFSFCSPLPLLIHDGYSGKGGDTRNKT